MKITTTVPDALLDAQRTPRQLAAPKSDQAQIVSRSNVASSLCEAVANISPAPTPPAQVSADRESSVVERLAARFVCDVVGLGGTAAQATFWLKAMTRRYGEPQRHYHTISHLTSMLACAQAQQIRISDPISVRLAVYFHDVIYDPLRNDNEMQSVALFEQFAEDMGLDLAINAKVHRYIEATISHAIEDDDDEDMRLFLDFDLEVLSRENSEYDDYAAHIRREYAHYPDDVYRAGRIKVLENFLLRGRLYFSDWYYTHCEDAARANLAREIASLQAQADIEHSK